MLKEVLSFLLGILIFPIAFACLPSFLSEINKKKRFVLQNKQKLFINDRLKHYLEKATIKSTNTAWINVFIQRFYVEMIKNYAFEDRMRNLLLKTFLPAIETGIIRNPKIINMEFGIEAPYINSLKILTKKELDEISNKSVEIEDFDLEKLGITLAEEFDDNTFINLKNVKEESPNTDDIAIDIKHDMIEAQEQQNEDFGNKKISIDDSDPRLGDSKTIEFLENTFPFKNETFSYNTSDFQDMYKYLVILLDVEYFGGCSISLEIELPKGIFVNSIISIRNIKGNFLLRLPAENYSTRFECAFLKDTKFDIEVESEINTGKSKIFFQRSLSSFLKSAILFSIGKSMVFPNWSHFYLGFLPSLKDIEHKTIKYTPENISDIHPLVTRILLYISCDYKILKCSNEIFCRIGNYNINVDDYIYSFDFAIPNNKSLLSNPIYINFEGLDSQDSRMLNKFADLSILEGILSQFKEKQVVFNNRNTSLIKLIFSHLQYEFVRIACRDCVIFQRNDPVKHDFFVFKINNKNIYVYSYSSTQDYKFIERRILKLKNKIYSQPMSVLGSNMLYKFIHLRRKNNFKPHNIVDNKEEEDEIEAYKNGISELEDMFFDALNIPDDAILIESHKFNIYREKMFEILKDDLIRIKLFVQNSKICRVFNESSRIKSLVVEKIKETCEFISNPEISEVLVHSYLSSDFIIDMLSDATQFFLFKVDEIEKDKCLLNIITKSDTPKSLLRPFFEMLQINISLKRYLDIVSEYDYERAPSYFSKEVKTASGGIWFEFFCEFEDDFQLKIISCKKKSTLFEIYKVISNKCCKVLVPTENDFVKIILIPKHHRNKYIQYKLIHLDLENEHFVDANIG